MNTPKPFDIRTPRLACAGMAAVVTVTLFISVAVGLTGEDGSALLATARPAAVPSPSST